MLSVAAYGFVAGATTLGLLAKFTGLGNKLVGTGSLKADKDILVKFLYNDMIYKDKYKCENNYKPFLLFQLCLNGKV